jgi:hypothetical protein
MSTPLEIILYNPDDSVREKYTKLRIPMGMIDTALDLSDRLTRDDGEVSKEMWMELKSLIVEIFGNQFTIQDLDLYGDLGDLKSVMVQIQAKVQSVLTTGGGTKAPFGQKPASRRKTKAR